MANCYINGSLCIDNDFFRAIRILLEHHPWSIVSPFSETVWFHSRHITGFGSCIPAPLVTLYWASHITFWTSVSTFKNCTYSLWETNDTICVLRSKGKLFLLTLKS
jgi:hypothetical protein